MYYDFRVMLSVKQKFTSCNQKLQQKKICPVLSNTDEKIINNDFMKIVQTC